MDPSRDEAMILVVVSILTLPHLCLLLSRLGPKQPTPTLRAWYESVDGKGTPESVGSFAASLRRAKIAWILIAIAGLVISASPFLPGLQATSSNPWFGIATWLALTLQSLAISTCWTGGYALSMVSFFAALPLLIYSLIRLSMEASVPDVAHRPGPAVFELCRFLASACLATVSVFVPRRPELVDAKGRQVDVDFSVTAANMFTFSWVGNIIAVGKEKGDLDISDLYRPIHNSRASGLTEQWREFPGMPLWASIIRNNWQVFLAEQTFAFFRSFISLAPSYCVLELLRRIETGDRRSYETTLWVLALFGTDVVDRWSGEVFWRLIWGRMSIPIRSQLTALVFGKALRAKDIKLADKDTGKSTADADAGGDDDGSPSDKTDNAGADTKNYSNLIGVDIERVSLFTATNVDVFMAPLFCSLFAIFMLNRVLGWKPLVAALVAMALFSAFNVYIIRRYSNAETVVMKARDRKMAVVSEALTGIRQIKFSAMEDRWQGKIGDIREDELHSLWNSFSAQILMTVSYAAVPVVLSVVAFAAYGYFEGSLRPSVAFSTLTIFNSYNGTLTFFPRGISGCMDAIISQRRLSAYLSSQDVDSSVHDAKATTILFEGASIAWPIASQADPTEARFVLRDINVKFPKGKLSVIAGKTGGGKSLMLAGILGEADVLEGKVVVPKGPSSSERDDARATAETWILPTAMAYVAQIPWIENASIRDNILFGLPMDRARFDATIDACALRSDLASFPDGEESEIGSNGINISGGQKWRLTLARAIYSRAGVIVLDDIFSAVDMHVSRHISDACLGGPLCKDRTVVLVTHHLSLCRPHRPFVLELGDQGVLYAGPMDDMPGELWTQAEAGQDKPSANDGKTDTGQEADSTQESSNAVAAPKVFVEKETRAKGAVSRIIYQSYIKHSGGWAFALTALVAFFSVQAFTVGRSWWVKIWTNAMLEDVDQGGEIRYYLGVYVGICAASIALHSVQCWYIYRGAIRASRALFHDLSSAVLNAPLHWLDKIPRGRLLNRFTRDFATIDDEFSNGFQMAVATMFELVGILVIGMIVSPLLVIVVALVGIICWKVGRDYMAGARPCKRLSATSMSDVMDIFTTSMDGIVSIRAFDRGAAYIQRINDSIDDYAIATTHFYMLYRWLGLRVGLVSSVFTGAIAAFVVSDTRISPSMAGFGLSFAIGISGSLFHILRYLTFVETSLSSAERIIEYSRVEPETKAGVRAPAAWPAEGRVEVNDLVVGYENLPPVLKGVSFTMRPGERVGVIGRTGAGKSSLTMALFRFLEARSGSVVVDGLDIAKMKLRDLRSRLAIVPQDPVLFSGTVRSNLDPFEQYDDPELLDALVRAHLVTDTEANTEASDNSDNNNDDVASPTKANPSSAAPVITLSTAISPGGLNLSAGQRQLLCLARAIITRARIVVMDEATSAVDSKTDALIQARVRSEFEGSTLLVVAHRLSTVADFDRILVLSDGQVAQYGTPRELWGGEDADAKDWGAFRAMCEESGDVEGLKKLVFGEGDAGSV